MLRRSRVLFQNVWVNFDSRALIGLETCSLEIVEKFKFSGDEIFDVGDWSECGEPISLVAFACY